MRPVTFKQAMVPAHHGLASPGLPVPAAATSNLNQSSVGEGTYLEASGGSRAIARGAVCVSRKRAAAAAARKEAGCPTGATTRVRQVKARRTLVAGNARENSGARAYDWIDLGR